MFSAPVLAGSNVSRSSDERIFTVPPGPLTTVPPPELTVEPVSTLDVVFVLELDELPPPHADRTTTVRPATVAARRARDRDATRGEGETTGFNA
jgi:hypothetical protein